MDSASATERFYFDSTLGWVKTKIFEVDIHNFFSCYSASAGQCGESTVCGGLVGGGSFTQRRPKSLGV